MVKSKEFEYSIHYTSKGGDDCVQLCDDVTNAMLEAGRLGQYGCVVHKIMVKVVTFEEMVVIDVDELRGE